jgi:hypothetical protein
MKSLLLFFMLACPILAKAQNQNGDLRTLLQDSAYVFNRFEEATEGLNTEIDTWNVPDASKKLFKQELAGALRNVASEKPALNALLLKNEVNATELFDLYSELTEVASEMSGQSSNFANWGDSTKAMELAQLGAKTSLLGAKIGLVLRGKIEAQENQLEACSSRPPAKKK